MAGSWACRCTRGTHYDVLQVSPWCEPDVIAAAYRALARSRHPDVNRSPDAEEEMRRLNAAYQVLSDPVRRARYDEECALMLPPIVAVRPGPPASPSASPTSGPSARAGRTPNLENEPDVVPMARPAARSRRSATASAAARSTPFVDPMRLDGRLDSSLPGPVVYLTLILVAIVFSLALWLLVDVIQEQRIFRGTFLDDGASTTPSVMTRSPYGGPDESRFSPALPPPAAQPALPERRERWTR